MRRMLTLPNSPTRFGKSEDAPMDRLKPIGWKRNKEYENAPKNTLRLSFCDELISCGGLRDQFGNGLRGRHYRSDGYH